MGRPASRSRSASVNHTRASITLRNIPSVNRMHARELVRKSHQRSSRAIAEFVSKARVPSRLRLQNIHMRTARKPPVQLEKLEQTHIIQLIKSLGGRVYVLGTRRSRGKRCQNCGTFVPEDQGTRQTPGVSDLITFLPARTRTHDPAK